jgi:hypothetical protein
MLQVSMIFRLLHFLKSMVIVEHGRKIKWHFYTIYSILMKIKISFHAMKCISEDSNCEVAWRKAQKGIVYCFKFRSRIFHLYRDVTIASEGLQNLCLCSWPLSKEGSIYRTTHALKRGLGFSGLMRRTTPFSHLLRHTKWCGGSILTRILTHKNAILSCIASLLKNIEDIHSSSMQYLNLKRAKMEKTEAYRKILEEMLFACSRRVWQP